MCNSATRRRSQLVYGEVILLKVATLLGRESGDEDVHQLLLHWPGDDRCDESRVKGGVSASSVLWFMAV